MRSVGSSSLDNILDPRHDYPAPDYGIPQSPGPGLIQAASTMSLPQMPMSTQFHISQGSQQGLLTTVGRPISDPNMQVSVRVCWYFYIQFHVRRLPLQQQEYLTIADRYYRYCRKSKRNKIK